MLALGAECSSDKSIFERARDENAIIMSKDSDFRDLVERHGPPPHIIWLTCGNTSNAALTSLLESLLPKAIEMIRTGEPLVLIG